MAVAEDWSYTFTEASAANPIPTSSINIPDAPLTLTLSDFFSSYLGSGSLYAGTLRPNVNVGNGGTWTIKFTVTNRSDEAVTIDAITLDAYALKSSGVAQSTDNYKRDINFTVTGDIEAAVVHSFGNPDPGNEVYGWDTNPVITLATPVEIGAGKDLSFTLKVSENVSEGCYIGLSGATISTIPAVPEPATATLSLLALAGLCARRRRK